MIRRILRLGPILVCAGMALPGCETLQHNLRPRSEDDAPRAAEAKSDEDESGDPPVSKGFFKSSRLSGAMSSEGREIEQSLGIH